MKNIIVSVFSGLLGAMVFTLASNYLYARPIAVIKLDEIIGSHLSEYGKKEMSNEDRQKVSETFAHSLNRAIQRISNKERVTLLAAAAVVSDAPDYTDIVKDEIRKALSEI